VLEPVILRAAILRPEGSLNWDVEKRMEACTPTAEPKPTPPGTGAEAGLVWRKSKTPLY